MFTIGHRAEHNFCPQYHPNFLTPNTLIAPPVISSVIQVQSYPSQSEMQPGRNDPVNPGNFRFADPDAKVTTGVVAERRPGRISTFFAKVEKEYGELGWKGRLMLFLAFIFLIVVVIIPLVVLRTRATPVSHDLSPRKSQHSLFFAGKQGARARATPD